MSKPADDFEAAFAQFSTPGSDNDAAPAAAATTDDAGAAATGGGDGSGDGGAAPAGDQPSGTDDAGSGDNGAAAAADAGAAPAAGEATDDKGGAGAGDGGEATPAAAAPAAAPAAAAPSDADAILDRLGKLVAAVEPKEPKKEEPAGEQAKPIFSDDEKAQLAAYDKDWGDVAKNEALKRRGEYQELLGYVFAQVQEYVKPLRDTIDALAGRAHLTDVRAAVTDYSDNLRQQVVDWVKTQPGYLQPAYDHVINNGTADEVKDLVDRYRQATGQAAPAPGGAPTGQQGHGKPKDNELSGAAKEAAAALAPVESKRSEVLTPSDPSNFDDAWGQFAKDMA